MRQSENRPACADRLFRARSTADADFLDHPVVVAPMLDQFDMAAVMAVVASIVAIVVAIILHVLVVAILVVVILPVMAANDNLAVVGLIVR